MTNPDPPAADAVPPMPASDVATYMEMDHGPVRDAMYLRTLASKVRRDGGDVVTIWEIPSVVASTLEGIAMRLLAALPAQTPEPPIMIENCQFYDVVQPLVARSPEPDARTQAIDELLADALDQCEHEQPMTALCDGCAKGLAEQAYDVGQAAIKENGPISLTDTVSLKAACLDCGLPYADFPLDLNLPRAQWLLIHPEGENGLLCAGCIVKRAAKIPGATVVHAVIEISTNTDSFRATCEPLEQELRENAGIAWKRARAAEATCATLTQERDELQRELLTFQRQFKPGCSVRNRDGYWCELDRGHAGLHEAFRDSCDNKYFTEWTTEEIARPTLLRGSSE